MLTSLRLFAVTALLAAAACGTNTRPHSSPLSLRGTTTTSEPVTTAPHSVDVSTPTTRSTADAKLAGASITAFGNDIFSAVLGRAAAGDNVVISPTSIAIALAMLEPGANDQGLSELRSLLHIADPKAFHDSMAALQQSLESRKASEQNDKPEGDVEMHVANAAFVQDGYPVQPAYVDAITRSYGPTVQRVDYASHTKQAIDDINAFVAKQTKDRIKTIVTDNDVDSDTVLALVNALYMKASWLTPFHKDETRSDTFHKRDSSTTTIQLMHGHSDASLRGDGWVAGTKQYIGNLAVQFVLPDEGHFDDVAGRIGTVFGAITYPPDSDADLAVPRFTTQQRAPLDDALKQRGLNAVFGTGYLLPIAHDPRLFVKTVAHATFLAMDEQGTEAAASTAVVANATSAPATPPERVPVILTRPFFFRILDTESGATLFVGRIMEPKEAS